MAVPFYLAHPRLERLEKAQMLAVEGGEHEWCMRILRHEAGPRHRQRLQAAAARSSAAACSAARSKPYPEFYASAAYSKSFVLHLDPWYAQSHPDEDFAETFAVWLTPESNWKTRYAGWPAIKKLEYMDELMQSLVGKKPLLSHIEEIDPLRRLNRSLRYHYKKKRRHYGVDHPTFYDRDLRKLFSDAPEHAGNMTAAQFLGRASAPGPQGRRRLDRHLPIHHRQGARRHHRPLPRTEAAARHAGRSGAAGIHRAADRAGHELPAQRPPPSRMRRYE